jgi:hypothetical protein
MILASPFGVSFAKSSSGGAGARPSSTSPLSPRPSGITAAAGTSPVRHSKSVAPSA